MCGVVKRTLRIDINSYGIFDMYFVLDMPYGSMCCIATSLKAFSYSLAILLLGGGFYLTLKEQNGIIHIK